MTSVPFSAAESKKSRAPVSIWPQWDTALNIITGKHLCLHHFSTVTSSLCMQRYGMCVVITYINNEIKYTRRVELHPDVHLKGSWGCCLNVLLLLRFKGILCCFCWADLFWRFRLPSCVMVLDSHGFHLCPVSSSDQMCCPCVSNYLHLSVVFKREL